MSHQPMSL